jgi:uncharacterized protein with PIN domain
LALYFLETSALVNLYVQEEGTEQLLKIALPSAGNQLAILTIAQVEFHSAVHRRTRDGDIDESVAAQILESFDADAVFRFMRQTADEAVLDLA